MEQLQQYLTSHPFSSCRTCHLPAFNNAIYEQTAGTALQSMLDSHELSTVPEVWGDSHAHVPLHRAALVCRCGCAKGRTSRKVLVTR